ncbi:hypothetical protein CBS147343_7179 [Aspergillus niger]|nr:hypothetical protein CBS147343_7179 [Aspergillus niger]
MASSKRLISGPPQNFPFGLQNSPLSGLAQVSLRDLLRLASSLNILYAPGSAGALVGFKMPWPVVDRRLPVAPPGAYLNHPH